MASSTLDPLHLKEYIKHKHTSPPPHTQHQNTHRSAGEMIRTNVDERFHYNSSPRRDESAESFRNDDDAPHPPFDEEAMCEASPSSLIAAPYRAIEDDSAVIGEAALHLRGDGDPTRPAPTSAAGTDNDVTSPRQMSRSIHSRLKLPPVVFVGTRAVIPKPHYPASTPEPWFVNNSPHNSASDDSDGPGSDLGRRKRSVRRRQSTPDIAHEVEDTRRGVAQSRMRRRRGLSHLQPTVLHLGELIHASDAALQSDLNVPLQRHIGVRSSHACDPAFPQKTKRRGVEFSDMALLGATVPGGTSMGLTLHHYPDDARSLIDNDQAAHLRYRRSEDKYLAHISVASSCPARLLGESEVRLEEILSSRRFREHKAQEADARFHNHRQRSEIQSSFSPVRRRVPPCGDLDAPKATHDERVRPSGTNVSLFSHTLNRRIGDMSRLVAPEDHKIVLAAVGGYELTSTATERRRARKQMRVPLPKELEGEFIERQIQRLHSSMTPVPSAQPSMKTQPKKAPSSLSTTAPDSRSSSSLSAPASIELAYQSAAQGDRQHSYGGGTAYVLSCVFGLDKPLCFKSHQ